MPGPLDPTRRGIVEGEPVILGVFNPVHAWRQRRARRRAEQQPAPPEPDEPPSSAEV